ncbi:MAG TPA: FkbM family methyltransferase [Candidatus Sulfotelmatobacter sp.]|nr:FkbM family methyltransferase [Candidatus Sulfotelmatobacter sp.]
MAQWRTPLETVRRTVNRDRCTIFDVGAHVGDMTDAYRIMFEHPTIHAFEPEPEAYAELERRFGAVESVTLNRLALADHRGTASLHQNSRSGTSSLLALNAESWWARQLILSERSRVEVPLETIDGYCADRGIDRIDLLKLDVQGGEPECLQGALGMLDRQAIRVIQAEILPHRIYQRRTSFFDIETLLRPRGYRLFGLIDAIGNENGELLNVDALYVLESEYP